MAGATFVLLNLSEVDHAAPVPKILFIDPSAGERQVVSIEKLIGHYFGPVWPKRTAILFYQNGARERVTVSGVLFYEINSSGAAPTGEVKDFLYPWLSDARQGSALKIEYRTENLRFVRYSGTNALVARFHLGSP